MSQTSDLSKPLKTWSHLVGNRRRPTEYEIVSTNMLWSTDDPDAPWAMGPDVPLSQWIMKFRNRSPLKHPDWNAFRDPDQLVYRTYNMMQDGQEAYIDGLLDDHNRNEHDLGLAPRWLEQLAALYTPARYLIHAQQMAAAYLVMMSPASTIENCFIFQCADQFRWVSRIAYRTAELAKTHRALGFGRDERGRWEKNDAWQGFRELLERLLVTWDWAEHFTALNLVVKPAVDEAFIRQLARAARRNGDTLTALLMDAQFQDSERCRRWTAALVRFATAGDDAANRHLLGRWIEEWTPLADQAIDAFCAALGEDGEAGAAAAKAATRGFRQGLGIAA